MAQRDSKEVRIKRAAKALAVVRKTGEITTTKVREMFPELSHGVVWGALDRMVTGGVLERIKDPKGTHKGQRSNRGRPEAKFVPGPRFADFA